jgi:hypothetical protein
MAEDPRTYQPSTTQANRGRMQGLGAGQKDMDAQQDPDRSLHATDPQRTERWENDPAGRGDDRGAGSSDMGAGAASEGQGNGETRSFGAGDQNGGGAMTNGTPDRNAAGIDDAGDLGAGTPPNVDIHKLGQEDDPQEDWGDPAAEGTMHSSNHTRRGVKSEAERGQGAKTRRLNKDIVSRRT